MYAVKDELQIDFSNETSGLEMHKMRVKRTEGRKKGKGKEQNIRSEVTKTLFWVKRTKKKITQNMKHALRACSTDKCGDNNRKQRERTKTREIAKEKGRNRE